MKECLSWAAIDKDVLVAMRQAMIEKKFPLFLYGGTGCGKTHAAACFYRSFRLSEEFPGTARWRRCGTLLAELTTAKFEHGVTVFTPSGESVHMTEAGLLKMWESADLTVLDDIGTEEATRIQFDPLLSLLDARAGKLSIITSNKSPTELQKIYDVRVRSRIEDGAIIKVTGGDRRADNGTFIEA